MLMVFPQGIVTNPVAKQTIRLSGIACQSILKAYFHCSLLFFGNNTSLCLSQWAETDICPYP
jgi:hypothetical protein